MLARLDKIAGVDRSFANHSGTLIRLALRSGADTEQVATEAISLLGDGTEKFTAVKVPGGDVAAVIHREQWRDAVRIRELSVIEYRTLGLRAAVVIVVIIASIGGAIYAWRRRRVSLWNRRR